jgi:threonylcarbamoyladenosine tRNA methylthiotransferase MtaB
VSRRPAENAAQADAPGFHTITLGCKLNQFDGAAIEGELARRGFRPESDPARAAVVIVNTCTVTQRADADARKLIRRVRRGNPGCRLLVTGCYAERAPQALRALDGVDLVFGNREKPRLGSLLDELGLGAGAEGAAGAGGDRGCDAGAALPRALHFGQRSRAFLKIQEGCRLACSYCIIPVVRGPSRSVPPAEVLAAARRLFDAGHREIVLTGVNTGDYGRDLDPPTDLLALLRQLLAGCGPNRLRLNSLEPRTVTDGIVELMRCEPRLAPHLQVPLQSGSDAILRGMRRNYGLGLYRERLERLRAALPDACLGADVIVGFPGETPERFEETCAFIAGSPLDYLHVFAWSPRPGTDASRLPGRVQASEIRGRSATLRALGDERFHRFRERFVGRELEAVVLGERADGATRALTGNFIEVGLRAEPVRRGDLVRVRVAAVDRRSTTAVVSDPEPAPTERPRAT